MIVTCRGGEITLEVVHDLRRDARPVDRVDRADAIFALELGIAADGLDHVLAIVEHAFDGDVENIGVGQREHLRGLEGAHPACRREHEYGDAALSPHRVFGGRPRVARRRADDVERRVLLRQHVLEQIAQQLHRDVLERQRRAIRDAQEIETVVEPAQRCDFIAAEIVGGVRTLDQTFEVGRRNIGEVARQDRIRELAVTQRTQPLELCRRKARIALRHRQAAVRRQALEEDRREGFRRSAAEAHAAGAYVMHAVR